MNTENILLQIKELGKLKYDIFSKIEKIVAALRKDSSADYQITFGKYEGKCLKDIPLDYIRWLQLNGSIHKWENRELKEHIDNLYPLPTEEP